MRIVKYTQTEFLRPWKRHKEVPLHRFILELPHVLYFSIVPSREALNEVLVAGHAGGGMGTGMTWTAFEITADEYAAVLGAWKNCDLRKILRLKGHQKRDLRFVIDEEILALPHHLDYLKRSREKYHSRFWKLPGLDTAGNGEQAAAPPPQPAK